jgi:transcriptional regulator with XRE-family HTH domain
MTSKDIGKTVREIRMETGLSCKKLGAMVGISMPQISKLENGQQGFRMDTLVRIAKALKVPPFRLYMTDGEWAKWSGKK